MDKKKILYTAAIVAAALIICGIMAVFSPNRCKLLEETTVTIPQGSSISDIADILKEEGVISRKIGFIAKTVMTGKNDELKYGEFEFSPGMSFKEVITVLCDNGAQKETVNVVIPEGYSVELIVKKFTDSGIADAEKFEEALNKDYDYEFLKYIEENPECKYRLQGFLFPSTYEFYKDATAEDVIKTMLEEFEKQYNKTGASYENISEIITKASLVEREAKLDEERAMIAGVIENRLEIYMLLQIDATAVYAITDGMYDIERVYEKDIKIDSKYNTYKYKGLPIGPICSPGLKSIEAVLSPAEHEYFYYRTTDKNDGSHRFSVTYEEHKKGA